MTEGEALERRPCVQLAPQLGLGRRLRRASRYNQGKRLKSALVSGSCCCLLAATMAHAMQLWPRVELKVAKCCCL